MTDLYKAIQCLGENRAAAFAAEQTAENLEQIRQRAGFGKGEIVKD